MWSYANSAIPRRRAYRRMIPLPEARLIAGAAVRGMHRAGTTETAGTRRRNSINRNAIALGVAIAVGAAVGAAFAVVMDSLIWIGVGAAMGIAAGLIFASDRR